MKKLIIIVAALLLSLNMSGQIYGNYPSLLATGGVPYSYYAILNPLDKTDKQTILSPNKLSVSTVAVGGGYRAVRVTIGVSASSANPLIYWEIIINSGIAANVGISNLSWVLNNAGLSPSPGSDVGGNSWGYINNPGGAHQKANAGVYSTYGSSYGVGDVVMIALDMTNGFIYFGLNGSWLNGGVPTSGATGTGAAFSGLVGTQYPTFGTYGGNSFNYTVRFDPLSFTYTMPAGYAALHH